MLTEKEHKVRAVSLFYSVTSLRTVAQETGPSDGSEDLLRRGKGGARIQLNFFAGKTCG